jgi:ethanolamine ammonia-lyase large subunit
MAGDTFNINNNNVINGGNNNNGVVQGDMVNTINNAGQVPTFDVVLSAVAQAVPVEHRSELMATVIDPIKDETKAAETQLADIDELVVSDQKEEVSAKVKTTLVDRVTKLATGLQPYAPSVTKALVAFGETALVGMQPPAGWVAGALLAAVKAMSAKTETADERSS